MNHLEIWVAHENVVKLQRQLEDPSFAGCRSELLRQLANERLKLGLSAEQMEQSSPGTDRRP